MDQFGRSFQHLLYEKTYFATY